MDETDQLDQVYEMAVHWADILLIATPIRWGAASSLYYKMVERMNCIQNQITLNNKVLIRNKVAAFIITGGQDGIQSVAGQMMMFFSEIGYLVPQFPFIAHSLGWEFEEMDRNVDFVEAQRGAARRRARAGDAQRGDVEAPAGARDDAREHRAGRQKGVEEVDTISVSVREFGLLPTSGPCTHQDDLFGHHLVVDGELCGREQRGCAAPQS